MSYISVVLPAYNEAGRIENAVVRVSEELRKLGRDFEIVIAEDGSTDGTDRIAHSLSQKLEFVRHLHSENRLGRGAALTSAFGQCIGEILVYMDVDLSVDPRYLRDLISAIDEGYDVATGSRHLPQSYVRRGWKREVTSRAYNWLVRLLLRSKIRDHQCGFKAFKRDSLMRILKDVHDSHWFWDTEVLVRAQRMGMRIKEIPVEWMEEGGTKVNLFKDSATMGFKVIRMFLSDLSSKIGTRSRIAIASSIAALILIALLTTVGVEEVGKTIMSASPSFLALALLTYSSEFLMRGIRYRKILSGMKHDHGIPFLTAAVSVSQSANVILPGRFGGDLIRAYILKRKKEIPYTSGISSVVVERIFDLMAVAIIALLSLIMVMRLISPPQWVMVLILLGLGGVAIFFCILAFMRGSQSIVGRMVRDMRASSLNLKSFIFILLTSVLLWIIEVMTTMLVFQSLGAFPPIPLLFLGVSVGVLVKAIPITPGGIGPYEATLFLIFSAGGISSGVGFSVALIDHAIKNFVTLLLGAISIYALGMRISEISRRND